MEEFKDITEHQLIAGEIGVFKGNKYLACKSTSVGGDCHKCTFYNNSNCSNPNDRCLGIYFQLVVEKKNIEPILESIDDTSDGNSAPTNICCEHFKTFIPLFSWFTIDEDTLIMPNVNNIRVQYCPSCGKYIRDIKLSKKILYNTLNNGRDNNS